MGQKNTYNTPRPHQELIYQLHTGDFLLKNLLKKHTDCAKMGGTRLIRKKHKSQMEECVFVAKFNLGKAAKGKKAL